MRYGSPSVTTIDHLKRGIELNGTLLKSDPLAGFEVVSTDRAVRAAGCATLTIGKHGNATISRTLFEALGSPRSVLALVDRRNKVLALQASTSGPGGGARSISGFKNGSGAGLLSLRRPLSLLGLSFPMSPLIQWTDVQVEDGVALLPLAAAVIRR